MPSLDHLRGCVGSASASNDRFYQPTTEHMRQSALQQSVFEKTPNIQILLIAAGLKKFDHLTLHLFIWFRQTHEIGHFMNE